MHRFVALVLVVMGSLGPAVAEEGMWPPSQLPEIGGQLQKAGLQLAPERLADLSGYPIDAVVSLGGCSASFVSPQGLIITNHHCAYGAIQYNSTPQRNLLEEGFLARSRDQELRTAPGSRVYVTQEIRDVTEAVLRDLSPDLSGLERYRTIEQREKQLVSDCEKEPHMRCRVAAFYGGLSYSLVRQLEIRDVRLVYAPPSGIGKFGGDIDNWMWPRHTGDYSFYRAYVAPDGTPVDYSTSNVPYQPRHFLKVATDGLQPGDYVMVAGYPGRTSRYRLATEVQSTFEWTYPARTRAYQQWLDIIEADTRDHPAAALKYASLIAGLNNTMKNNEGMLAGYAKSDMLEKKEVLERQLQEWIQADPERMRRFGSAYSDLLGEIKAEESRRALDFYYGLAGRSSMLSTARRLYRLAKEKEKPDAERDPGYQERDLEQIRNSLDRLDRRYDPAVDRDVFAHFILEYHEQVPAEERVRAFDHWFGLDTAADVSEAVRTRLAEMYDKTTLGDSATRLRLMDASVKDLEASGDPFIRLAVALYPSDEEMRKQEETHEGQLEKFRPRYMQALLEFLHQQGKTVYPDANGTLRVTYGTIKGYSPRDAVEYEPFTSVRGVLEKDTGKAPFDTPAAALEAMGLVKPGRWFMNSIDSVPVNFLSTCDTTGGNSGSPTLNGRGELVGLLFDGNYESMIADWDFLPRITRSIHVDIRYVLWIMDKVDHANELLTELGVEP